MSIAITEDHRALADTASDFLLKRDARGAARALLESRDRGAARLLGRARATSAGSGCTSPRQHGGSGFGLPELVVVVEELGRALAPGPFVPTVIASAVLAAAAPDEMQSRLLPGLADGIDHRRGRARRRRARCATGKASGSAGVVLGGGLADILLVAGGDDVAVVDVAAGGVTVDMPPNLDPTRRAARVTLDGAPAEVIPGARQVLVDLARTILAAEAAGIARECTELAGEYAKVREQFGRPIAMFQAVKHHCANMLVATELATAAVWDAARAAATGGDQLSLHRGDGRDAGDARPPTCAPSSTSRCTAASASRGSTTPTSTCGGRLRSRRSSMPKQAANDVTDLYRRGVRRARSVDLPPEAEAIRDTVRDVRRSDRATSTTRRRAQGADRVRAT